MDWKRYEDAVRDIYEQLGEAAGVKIICSGSGCKAKGKSKVEHQIDVLTSHSDGLHTYRTAIECKYWADKIQKDTVTKLAEILEDAKIEKGVIVSKTGFTPDAVTFAQYKNISLVELREPTDDDWKGRIKDIGITLRIQVPHITDIEMVQPASKQGTKISISALASDVIFEAAQWRQSFHELLEDELRNNVWRDNEERRCEVKLPAGACLRLEGESLKASVEAVRFCVKMTITEQKIDIRGVDYVSMVMHSIFEGKSFVIDKNGRIRASRL